MNAYSFSGKKKLIYICIIIVTMLLMYCGINRWYNGRFVHLGIGNNGKNTWTTTELNGVAKDFQLEEDNVFIAISSDPWFTITENFPVKTIIIDVDFLSDKRYAQIFYYSEEQDLQSENSFFFVLKEGINFIQIPKGEYTRFRLDLVENTGVRIKINEVITYGSRVWPCAFWAIVVIACIGIGKLLYMWLFKRTDLLHIYNSWRKRLGEYRFFKYILLVAMLITLFIVYGKIRLMGHEYVYYDIGGGDEPEACIPSYVNFISKIRTGTLAEWNFNMGLGTSTYGWIQNLLNPSLLIVFVSGTLFGISVVNTMLLVGQLLNIVICGLLCYKYLQNFESSCASNAIASYIFAFNGYLILFAQQYSFQHFCFYLLVLLIIIEKILQDDEKKKYYLYFVICVACMLATSVYMSYMAGIFCVFYIAIRGMQLYAIKDFKIFMKKIGSMLLLGGIGLTLAAPLVFTSVNEILLNSDRVLGETVSFGDKIREFLLVPYSFETIKTNFLRLMSNNFEGAGNDFIGTTGIVANDYYSAPMLYFSVFILAFVVIYFATLHKRINSKTQYFNRIIAFVLVYFLIFNRLGSASLNAFVATFGRYSFLLMPVFAVVASVALDEIEDCGLKEQCIWVGALLLTGLIVLEQTLFVSDKEAPAYLMDFMILEVGLVICSIVLFVFFNRIGKQTVYIVFSLLIMANVVSDSFVTVNKRAFCAFSEDLIDMDDYGTQDALMYVNNNDSSMYRLEKNYYDLIYFNDALFQEYRGMSTYNSTLNANVKEFYRLYCNPSVNFYGPDSFWYSYLDMSNDVLQSSIMGIRYILSDGGGYENGIYELEYSNDNIMVYRNTSSESFGIFYDKAVAKSEILDLNYADRLRVLSKAIVIGDGYAPQKTELTSSTEILEELKERQIWSIDEDLILDADEINSVEISFDDMVSNATGRLYLEFLTDLEYSDKLMIYFDTGEGFEKLVPYYYRGSATAVPQQARILLPEGIRRIKVNSSRDNTIVTEMKIMLSNEPIVPNSVLPIVNLIHDDLLEGSITNKNEGYLFLPIPFEKGWSAVVDGERVPIIQADSGFMAIKLYPGTHSFTLEYHYPAIYVGILLVIIGVIFLFCIWYCFIRNTPVYKFFK